GAAARRRARAHRASPRARRAGARAGRADRVDRALSRRDAGQPRVPTGAPGDRLLPPAGDVAMGETIVSGARPTGRQHLGNYQGALKNWLGLQETERCFSFVADWHALTPDWASPAALDENTTEMVLDWLSVGLDPARATIFRQSAVKEHAELYLLLGM